LLARKTFEQTVPVSTFNAAGAANAFNVASTLLIDDVLTWLTPAALPANTAHSH
jgi:cholesterol transport system auxiliary component